MATVEQLLEELRASGISSPAVLNAMRSVPRENFLPDEWRAHAYDNIPLPLAEGQTISQPYIVAIMTQALLKNDVLNNVLEIGTGWGYQAAILSCCVGHLTTIERIPSLYQRAKIHLQNYKNVTTLCQDGYEGYPAKAPFDGIIVTAAPTEIPKKLVDQLRDGCRMVIPVGPAGDQELLCLTKQGEAVTSEILGSVRFVPML